MTTSMSPEQAAAQWERAARRYERWAVIAAAREVINLVSHLDEKESEVNRRALRQAGSEVIELLGDLNDAQRTSERHDADNRDGDELLASYLAALRAPRDEAQAAARELKTGHACSVHVRRANALTWAVNKIRPAATSAIAKVRQDLVRDAEYFGKEIG